MAGVKGRSGRPPKARSFGVNGRDYDFVGKVTGLACVRKVRLTDDQIKRVADRLLILTGYYEATKQLVSRRVGTTSGAKPKDHLHVLLFECGDLWQQTTGKEVTKYGASPHIQLAKLVLELVGERVGNLRRMATQATRYSRVRSSEDICSALEKGRHKVTLAGLLGL